MQSATIIGTIPLTAANSALDNLTEADFSESDISVVTQESATARRLVKDGGPLKGATLQTLPAALQQLCISDASKLVTKIDAHTALIAVRVSKESAAAAQEILQTAGATVHQGGNA